MRTKESERPVDEFTRVAMEGSDRYRDEIVEWYQTGKEPESADPQMKYQLQLEADRLREHHIQKELKMVPDGEKKIEYYFSIRDTNGESSESIVLGQTFMRKVRYRRDGKKLSSRWHYDKVFEKLENQEDPAVIGSYIMEAGGFPDFLKKKVLKGILIFTLVAATLSALLFGAMADMDFMVMFGAFALNSFLIPLVLGLASVPFALGYLILSMLGVSHVVAKGMMNRTAWSGRLSELSAAMDINYFEERVMNLSEMIVMNDDPDHFIQYRGPVIGDGFKDIVERRYCGGFKIFSLEKKEDRIEASLRLMTDDLTDQGKKLKRVRNSVIMEMYHDTSNDINPEFTLSKAVCPHCGRKFNALEHRCCPDCGKAYDPALVDWVVTKIEKEK